MNNKYILLVLLLSSLLITSCDREVFTGPPEDPPPVNGMIFVNSEPQGATIYLNGRNQGIFTPDTLRWLNESNYQVTLKSYLFQDRSFYVTPVVGSVQTVFLDYMADPLNAAAISFDSDPENAAIFLNDSAINLTTPSTLTGLYPGTYKIKYTFPEHRADSLEIFVKGSETGEAYIALEDTSISVSYKKVNSDITSNLLSAVVVDANGVKWIGTRDKGVLKFENNEWTVYNSSNSILPSNAVTQMVFDDENNLWVGTALGLVKYDGIDWRNYSFVLPHTYVSAIEFDDEGNGWFGTQSGLVKYDGANYIVFKTTTSDLSDDFITLLMAEGSNMWIGTNAGGINYFDGATWTLYNKTNTEMQGDGVLSGIIDHNGNKWFDILPMPLLEEYGGLVKYDGNNWSVSSIGTAMDLRKVYSIIEDEQFNLWFGTKSGIAKMTPDGTVSVYDNSNSSIPSIQVNKLAIDANNDIWIATNGSGLIKFKKNKQ